MAYHMVNRSQTTQPDEDALETQEWRDSLTAVIEVAGADRGAHILRELQAHALALGVPAEASRFTAYRNTIPLEAQAWHPGNVALEERLTALMRWNALAMVVRANRAYGELGGHISSYASAAEIFEIGFNHFFRGPGFVPGWRFGVFPGALCTG